ncbi:transcription factor SCREAM-like protein [Citrus sinensis]|nr:transcription factor SCREAM-like protein [Citrus sinensis]
MENAQTSSDQNALPIVSSILNFSQIANFIWQKLLTVKTLQKGFMINVFSKKSCPGLLVSILGSAFEELALNVLEARVSCTDTFSLQAIGGKNEEQGETIDAHVVKQALLQVIRNWSESNEQV